MQTAHPYLKKVKCSPPGFQVILTESALDKHGCSATVFRCQGSSCVCSHYYEKQEQEVQRSIMYEKSQSYETENMEEK